MTSGAFIHSAIGRTGKDDETSQEDPDDDIPRPSIFSIIASDGLMSTIRPALEHILW